MQREAIFFGKRSRNRLETKENARQGFIPLKALTGVFIA